MKLSRTEPPSTPPASTTAPPQPIALAGVVAAVVVTLAVAVVVVPLAPARPNAAKSWLRTMLGGAAHTTPFEIAAVDWTQLGADPAHAIAAGGQPVRVRGSPADALPALQWTPAELVRRLGGEDVPIRGVITSRSPNFVYYNGARPMTRLPGLEAQRLPVHEKRTVALGEFLRSVDDARDGQYMYWVAKRHGGNLPEWMEADLAGAGVFSATGEPPKLQLWFGEQGITSSFHYDASHNFYLQLRGTKTFAILPPSAAPAIAICPFLHPGDGHSCLDWSQHRIDDADGFGAMLGSDVRPAHVNLEPGDVLYLPPYWLHHVVTTSAGLAVSASLITESREQALMKTLEGVKLPVSAQQTAAARLHTVETLLKRLLAAVAAIDNDPPRLSPPAQALRSLLSARYRLWRAAADTLLPAQQSQCAPPTAEGPDNADIDAAVATAAGLFAQIGDRGAREILLFNYVEALAATGLGGPHATPQWLRHVAEVCWLSN